MQLWVAPHETWIFQCMPFGLDKDEGIGDSMQKHAMRNVPEVTIITQVIMSAKWHVAQGFLGR